MKLQLTQVVTILLVIFLTCHIASGQQEESEQLWIPWRDKHKRRQYPGSSSYGSNPWAEHAYEKAQDRIDIVGGKDDTGEETSEEVPVLNVSREDSPYALINKFFPEREENHKILTKDFEEKYKNGQLGLGQVVSIGNLDPKEVWLSEGNLLVLKGGSTPDRDGIDNFWEPLDDYQAPYREPKLPPPDFVPTENGVGVPLPPSDDEDYEDSVENDTDNYLDDYKNEQQNFISRMENFHAIRHKLVSEIPSQVATTEPPSYLYATTTPESYSFSYLSPTTPPPTTESPQNKPTQGPFVITTYRSSYGNFLPSLISSTSENSNLRTLARLPTPAPSRPSEKPQSNRSNKYSVSESDNEVQTDANRFHRKRPIFRNRYHRKRKNPNIVKQKKNSLIQVRRKARQRRLHVEPPKASDIRSLPLNGPHHQQPVHPHHVMYGQFQSPSEIFTNILHRNPPIHPTAQSNFVRRSGNNASKYVSFFRGTVGGKSWGYSYRL